MQKDYTTYAAFMRALSDETRIKIFIMLSQGELCACNILEEFHITQPTLSYHMKILCESGLVLGRKEGIWMKYSINLANLSVIKGMFEQISTSVETQRKYLEKCGSKC